ncbi:MAG: minor capsid protein [Clostridiales bacterium]|jgi:hypothetical protein|nr:minor capsid protein [Clostridiales bacterium]
MNGDVLFGLAARLSGAAGLFDPEGAAGDIFINILPEAPDGAAALFLTGGAEDVPGVFGGIERRNVRALTRGVSGEEAARRLRLIEETLCGKTFRAGGAFYCDVRAARGAESLGRDENGRFLFERVFAVSRKEAAQ